MNDETTLICVKFFNKWK